jgi:site-specific recombinase XerD
MTPLRKRMIEDMQLRHLAPETQRSYLHHITGLAQFYQTSPEHLTLEDLRQHQVYLAQDCLYSADSLNQFVSAAKFLYDVTLEAPFDTGGLLRAKVPHRLPTILSPQEVVGFFEHVHHLRDRTALMVAYGAGLRVSEVVALKVADIDSSRMLLRVQQGKGQRDRYAMLSPRLLQVLRAWWRAARPTEWLFPSGPVAAAMCICVRAGDSRWCWRDRSRWMRREWRTRWPIQRLGDGKLAFSACGRALLAERAGLKPHAG